MSQAGYTPISLYYSTTAAATPSAGNLVAGELALNTVDEKLYFKNSAGTVKLLASNATSAPVTTFSAGSTGLTPNTATTGAVTLAGTLAVANGGTGLTAGTSGGVLAYTAAGTLASSSALAASALVIGGGAGAAPSTTTTGTGVVTALGVNTGTAGAFVVNGGALGTPASGTLTNATGLPLTTGVTGTLPTANGGTNLTSFTSGGVVYASSTSALATGSALTFDGTNLGVGTASPSGKLQVQATNSGIYFDVTNAYTPKIIASGALSDLWLEAVGNGGAFVNKINGSASQFQWYNGASELMRLNNTGLGIGTSSPAYKLDVRTAGSGALNLYNTTASSNDSTSSQIIASNGTYWNYLYNNASSHRWATYSSEVMRLDSAGNLGLGVTPSAWRTDIGPAKAVQLPGGSVWAFSTSEISLGQNYYYGAGGGRYRLVDGKISNYFQSSGEHYWQTSVTGLAGVAATNIDIMALDSSGNLTISTGNVVIGTAGKGIDFSATSSGSGTMTSELLADYEEGTFTPTDTSGASLTFSAATGTYTKIGRLVTLIIRVVYPSTVSTASAKIGSFPFVAVNNPGGFLIGTDAAIDLTFRIDSTTSTHIASGGTFTAVTNASLSLKEVQFTYVYFT